MAKAWSTAEITNLSGRRAIITGGNSGIGFPTARELARHGAEIVLAVRDLSRGEDAKRRILARAPSASVEIGLLDLASQSSVRAFAEREIFEGKPIDLLINNAGIFSSSKRLETRDGFELQFGTNVLGPFALTGLLLPLLERASERTAPSSTPADDPLARPRIVWVASIAHRRGRIDFNDLQSKRNYKSTEAYSQTKLADLMLAIEMDRRLKAVASASGSPAILSLAAHPGIANTNIFQVGDFSAFEKTARRVVGEAIGMLLNTDAEGALPTLYAATADAAKAGGYYGPQGLLEMRGGDVGPARIMPQANDQAAAKRLWEVCEELTGVRFL